MLEQFEGMEMPDKAASIDVVSNPVQLISSLFTVWAGFVARLPAYFGNETPDKALAHAEELLAPYDLPCRCDDAAYFLPLKTLSPPHYDYGGLFYTALLHTGVEYLRVPSSILANNLGYKLRSGYLEVVCNTFKLGTMAQGGAIINKGAAQTFASSATGGIFINCSSAQFLGNGAYNGLFINFGAAAYMGYEALNGLFISTKQGAFLERAQHATGIGPYWLGRKKDLHLIVETLREECLQEDIDPPRITDLAQKIQSYVTSRPYMV
ncbi:hypothetical protein HY639_03950 [Candidatus Woesearchaeota archaeon]|nr:hypothetical protein [Candidatus Woesearchaeota archaeon]